MLQRVSCLFKGSKKTVIEVNAQSLSDPARSSYLVVAAVCRQEGVPQGRGIQKIE